MIRSTVLPIGLGLMLAFGPCTTLAQEAAEPDGKTEGLGLMERGMQLFFRQLLDDMEPALDDMKQALTDLEPMVKDLGRMIGDVRNYEAPEKLPNGDILIRRKPDAPPPPQTIPEGEIEL